tara:strand:- start:370 stop:804 length:435 start_codon:yes stop_codon:yes gene_type:complete
MGNFSIFLFDKNTEKLIASMLFDVKFCARLNRRGSNLSPHFGTHHILKNNRILSNKIFFIPSRMGAVNSIMDWLRGLFWKQEMELTLVGLQNSGKTTLVNVISVCLGVACFLSSIVRKDNAQLISCFHSRDNLPMTPFPLLVST